VGAILEKLHKFQIFTFREFTNPDRDQQTKTWFKKDKKKKRRVYCRKNLLEIIEKNQRFFVHL
jgi:hypothetical protein